MNLLPMYPRHSVGKCGQVCGSAQPSTELVHHDLFAPRKVSTDAELPPPHYIE